jgi:hypothetical protein
MRPAGGVEDGKRVLRDSNGVSEDQKLHRVPYENGRSKPGDHTYPQTYGYICHGSR